MSLSANRGRSGPGRRAPWGAIDRAGEAGAEGVGEGAAFFGEVRRDGEDHGLGIRRAVDRRDHEVVAGAAGDDPDVLGDVEWAVAAAAEAAEVGAGAAEGADASELARLSRREAGL